MGYTPLESASREPSAIHAAGLTAIYAAISATAAAASATNSTYESSYATLLARHSEPSRVPLAQLYGFRERDHRARRRVVNPVR